VINLKKRFRDQRNIDAGGIVPETGLKEKPQLESDVKAKGSYH
jgi:hypothetical protein